MAAPTPTARGTPAGIKLREGHASLVTLSNLPTASFWEIEAKPPGIDGGDAINATTMHNSEWREMRARQLKTLTPQTIKFAYDPNLFSSSQVRGEINREQTITQEWFDNTTLAYYGYPRSIEFDPLVEGQMPTGTLTIQPTNFDPTNKVEAGPVITSVSGT